MTDYVGDRFGALASAGHVIGPNGEQLPVKYACLTQSAAGNDELVAAVAGARIRVLGWVISRADSGAHMLQSFDGSTYTAITGSNTVAGLDVAPVSPLGWCETLSGESLVLTTTVKASITLAYVEYPGT